MKKTLKFYIKTFLIVSFISIPFIFIDFANLKATTFSYKMWIAAFCPQLIYILYLFRDKKMYDSFKTAFLGKEWSVSFIVISGLMPFIVYFSLIGFQLIKIDTNGTWDIEILVYFILLFLSALLEEILFRFIPYTILLENPSLKEILVVSLLFSVFHVFNPNINVIGIVNLIIAGVFFSLIYLKTNSILVVSFIHAFWNFSIGCLMGSNISGIKIISILRYKPLEPFFLSGGNFGFEGSLLTSLAFLICCVFLYNLKPGSFIKISKSNEL